MQASQKKLKTLCAIMSMLFAALVVCLVAKPAEGRVIGKQRLSVCTRSAIDNIDNINNCETKLEITVPVSYGLSSTLDMLDANQTIRDGEVNSLVQGVPVKITKTQPTVTYPLKYFHTVAYFPHEEVIRVQNTSPGSQTCVDALDAPYPTCGWTTWGGEKIADSQGFCSNKDLLELIRGDAREWWRGETILGQQSTLQDSFSTGHCLRMGELYYAGYEIGEPVTDYEIEVEMDNGGDIYQFQITPADPVYRTMDDSNYTGLQLDAELLGDMAPYKALPQLGNYILYIPTLPLTHEYVQNYQYNMLLVPREEVSKDGSELNKVGVGFWAFRRQTAAAAVTQGGDGLHNQLYHKHNKDLLELSKDPTAEPAYLVHGMRAFKRSMTFEPGMAKTLQVNIPEINYSLVHLRVDAEDAGEVAIENQVAIIIEASVAEFASMSKQGTMAVKVKNNGNGPADFIVSVTDCNMAIVQAIPAQARSINPMEIVRFYFDIFTQYNMMQTHQCTVVLKSSTGKKYDSADVIFDTRKYGGKYSWELLDKNEGTGVTSPW